MEDYPDTIDYNQLLHRHLNDETFEGVLLDYMLFSGEPSAQFLLEILENFECPAEHRDSFFKAITIVAKKNAVSTDKIKQQINSILGIDSEGGDPVKEEEYTEENIHNACKKAIESADLRILQISDIHMGLLHSSHGRSDTKPHEALLLTLRNLPEVQKPHLCIISGDLTSISSEEEFQEATDFLNRLATGGSLCKSEGLDPKSQILVVPGNHDTKWNQDSLTTDKLELFKAHVSDNGGFITPYGVPNSLQQNNLVAFSNQDRAAEENLPPFSVVHYPELGIEVSLLTSSYYSGELFRDERREKLLKTHALLTEGTDSKQATDTLRNILVLDDGYLSSEYFESIDHTLRDARKNYNSESAINIAVTHHPVVPCGKSEPCYESNALRTRLKQLWKIPIVVHGHAHAINKRPDEAHSSRATGIGCPALSAIDSEDSLGVLLHCIDSRERKIESIAWNFDPEGTFLLEEDYLTSIASNEV
ncbi:MAG: metallophosphoesterase [Candidatus Thiodiazotropha endolucinida]